MPPPVKMGDVFAISTPKGLAYFQVTHHDSVMGHFIRVLPGTYREQPDLDSLIASGLSFQLARHGTARSSLA